MATNLQPSSPNKRPKILALNPHSRPSNSLSKGKSIAQDDSADCCGICLSEAGFSRGQIDCCDHYYCFVCIMEWAKVESKCPLCKRRFSTIRRPPKPPVFAHERVVNIPVRDQVYHYSGNATVGPPDLYSEAKCSMCKGMTDESLLLLCDLCDSAAHTYCVGLGYTIPEGDWFCQDCALLRDEHLESESKTDSHFQMSFPTANKISTNEHISALDIVRGSHGHLLRSSGSPPSDPCHFPPPTSTDETVTRNNIKRSSSTSLEISTQHPPKPNARTLRQCRNLHDRIRVLRQNWNGLRSGAFHFSSNRDEGNISEKSASCRKSKEHSASSLSKQSVAQCSSSDVKNDKVDPEIQKAWEMFDKAKSIREDHEKSKIVCQASKFLMRKPVIKSVNYISDRQTSLNSQQDVAKNVRSMGAVDHNHSFEKNCYEQPSSSSGKRMWKLHVDKALTYCDSKGSIIGHSPGHQEPGSSNETPSHLHNANTRNVKLPAAETVEGTHCLGSDVVVPVVPNIDQVQGANHMSSSHSKVKPTKEERESKQIYVDRQTYNDAKSEVQSLVKLNLKLQTKEKKLEVDAFKEVARLATHTILGACGLEQPRPRMSSIPGIICSHTNHINLHHKSSLMPSTCRECFYVFVKDVVISAMSQKKGTRENL